MSDNLKEFCAALTPEEQEQVLDFLLDDADVEIIDETTDEECVTVPYSRFEELVRSETELNVIYGLCINYRIQDDNVINILRAMREIRGEDND